MRILNTRRFFVLIVIVLLLVGTSASVYLAQNKFDLRQFASADLPTISLTAPVSGVTQTGIDSVSLILTRQGGDLTKPLVVRYTVLGNAEKDGNVNLLPKRARFSRDQTTLTIPIKSRKNKKTSAKTSLTVTLVTDSSYIVSNPSSQTITVNPPPPDSAFLPRTSGRQSVIVQLRSSANPEGIANASGVSPKHIYKKVLNGFSGEFTPSQIAHLQDNPDVVSIEENRIAQVQAQTVSREDQRIGLPTNPIAQIGTGNSINLDVAVIDTGIDVTHPDLNVVGGKACVTGNTSYVDDHGHGTKVAGLIGAKDNGVGVVGMAPGVRLWSVKVADATGQATWAAMICGMDWVAQNATTIKVANMSIDGTGADDTCSGSSLHRSVCNLVNAGVTLVVAAANYSQDANLYVPATYAETIAVGAMVDTDGKPGGLGAASPYGPDDSYATFSNFGPDVDISAPGYNTTSTTRGGGYGGGSGTSFSSPIVAGAAALYVFTHPGATPAQVRAGLLAQSALPLPTYPNGFIQNRASTPGNMVWLGVTDPNIVGTTTPTPTSGPTPTSTCISIGGSGGDGTNPPPGVLVRPGDGGSAANCLPGTNGYTVNADNYCSTHNVIITWPTTTTATYYKLLIDNAQVQNGSGLSFTASGYSVGPQHIITLFAGNSTKGDFAPSTGGYFQIGATACIPTPTPTTIVATNTPIPSLTAVPIPTSTLQPTPTISQNRTLQLTLLLNAIGNGGDAQAPGAPGNFSPLTPQRNVNVQFSQLVQGPFFATTSALVNFNQQAGNFQGQVAIPAVLLDGSYFVSLQTPRYTKSLAPSFITLDASNTTSSIILGTTTMIVGDANGDSSLDLLDYNMLADCFSISSPPRACDDPNKKIATDFNDDGKVDGIDLNYLVRNAKVRGGQ